MKSNRNIFYFNIIGETPKGGDKKKKDYNPHKVDTIPNKDNLFTRKEAANYLNISVSTLDNYVRAGMLPRVKIGPRMVRFTKEALDEFIKGNNRLKS